MTLTTNEEDDKKSSVISMPQKKFYRSRAHCNPLSHNNIYEYPHSPDQMNWKPHYPNITNPVVEIADVGCGFGGLTVALAKLFPNTCTLAMEIRPKVTEYVRLRIEALRNENPGHYQNVSVIKTNAMRYLPNFFRKRQLSKLFFCFPDPQFKTKNHRRRIISPELLTEYVYLLRPGGIIYTITDVEDLYNWHVEKCSQHPYLRQLPQEEMDQDPCISAMLNETEEGKKVARAEGKKYLAVFKRLDDDEVVDEPLFPSN